MKKDNIWQEPDLESASIFIAEYWVKTTELKWFIDTVKDTKILMQLIKSNFGNEKWEEIEIEVQ